MEAFEFGDVELMHLPFGVVVCGRCYDVGFGVGDVFTELRWSQSECHGSPPRYERVAEDIATEVRLRVEEISVYNRLIDYLDPGLTAGIRVSGPGLEALAGIDFAADLRVGKVWSLWGQRHAEPGAAADGGGR